MFLKRQRGWELPERESTPEAIFYNRRQVLHALGLGTAALAGSALLPPAAAARSVESLRQELAGLAALSAKRNPKFALPEAPTPAEVAARYNNFYEFNTDKNAWEDVEKFQPRPWRLQVGGLVDNPRTYDVDDLVKRMPLEERVYRFRCVEAWSMVVPWVGFPLAALLKEARPKSGAKFVKFTTFLKPDQAPRQGLKGFFGTQEPWPYTEGLTLAEASNDLALLTVGNYGKVLPKQQGAPIRLIVPWKYGFKNIKSIVKIDLVAEQPATFWNTLGPQEYGFESNVDPRVPHPRWSQMFERDIGTRERKPTLYLNGYDDFVGGLYKA
jgi:sulfoxide reductase catalytic subunit YedY